jgi:hypothetical protein
LSNGSRQKRGLGGRSRLPLALTGAGSIGSSRRFFCWQGAPKASPDSFRSWLGRRASQVPPETLLGKAVEAHSLPDHAALTRDTNAVENAIRPFVLGRKNWLFSGSPRRRRSRCPTIQNHRDRENQWSGAVLVFANAIPTFANRTKRGRASRFGSAVRQPVLITPGWGSSDAYEYRSTHQGGVRNTALTEGARSARRAVSTAGHD